MTFTLKKWLWILTIPLIFTILLVSLVVYSLLVRVDRNPAVKTKVGSIQGVRASDGDYDMYLGVPYAHVDANNAFGPAIPSGRFKKIYIAHDDSVICPQFEEFNKTITGSIDCLRLNIYVPHSSDNSSVLVYIHGGEYSSGHGGRHLYGPKYLVQHGIIIITVNYRLGPYGFICVDIPEVSGNQGLKDQVLALRWIRDNIKFFGGDPDQVTLAGVGSGGENVNLHLLYGGESLFQKVIIESGIYIEQLDDEDGNESIPIELADNFGLITENETEAMNFLKSQKPESVIASSMRSKIKYGPCIERNVEANTFITNQTLNSTTESIRTVPILIGQSDNELLKVFAHRNLDNTRRIFRDDLVKFFKLGNENTTKMEKKVKEFYIGDDVISNAVRSKIINFKSDLYHNMPTKRMIEKYLQRGANKIYYGVFSYSGGSNFVKRVYNITADGAAREDILGYLFDMPYIPRPISDSDQLVMQRMTTLWANFVKYGDPTPTTNEVLPVKWEPVADSKLNYLKIASELEPRDTPFHNRTAFWGLFYKLNGSHERQTKLIEPWKY